MEAFASGGDLVGVIEKTLESKPDEFTKAWREFCEAKYPVKK